MSDELDPRIHDDAQAANQVPADLWARIEADLDNPGVRDGIASLSTTRRRLLGAGILGLCGLAMVWTQGIRPDLDASGWATFASAAGLFVFGSLLAASFSLRSRGDAPLPAWPWVPLTWVFMASWATLGPWPGMTGVPAEMHAYCFGATSAMVVAATIGFAVLERSRRPVPWRIALAAAASGLAAFAFQSVFCPGVDVGHLILGHGGAGILWALVAAGLAWVLQRV